MPAPPRTIPYELLDGFTMGGRIPVREWYFDDRPKSDAPRVFAFEEVEELRERARRRESNYYGDTDQYLYRALGAFPIAGQDVAIVGSETPWYEAVCLAHGARSCTTIEPRPVVSQHPAIRAFPSFVAAGTENRWSAVVSISSIEHFGLGRYGDQIEPDGDLQAMSALRSMLRPSGALFLAVPLGQDAVWWNAHRVYGQLRLAILLKGWKLAGYYGASGRSCMTPYYQPVIMLQTA